MIIAQRWAMIGNGLPYDAEVEYIEAVGSQWINTETSISPAGSAIADMQFTRVDARQQRVFEQYDRNGHLFFALYVNSSGKMGYAYSQTVADWNSVNYYWTTGRMTVKVDGPNRGVWTDSIKRLTLPLVPDTGRPEVNLTLGSSGTNLKPTYIRWYSVQIIQDGVVVRDYQPVRIGSGSSARGCLFDKVTGRIFENQGTGVFLCGPDRIAEGGGLKCVAFHCLLQFCHLFRRLSEERRAA